MCTYRFTLAASAPPSSTSHCCTLLNTEVPLEQFQINHIGRTIILLNHIIQLIISTHLRAKSHAGSHTYTVIHNLALTGVW